ncbi:hypothetical protein [Rhodococcus koreensis]
MVVIQSTVLSLRNLLDDLTQCGWEQAPPRRLVFAADVPRRGGNHAMATSATSRDLTGTFLEAEGLWMRETHGS